MTNQRRLIVLAALTVLAVLGLWVLPVAGGLLALAALATVPPVGRTMAERFFLSVVITFGVIAVVFPMASSTPVNSTSAKLLFSALLLAALALRAIPRLRDIPVRAPKTIDSVVLVVMVLVAWWPLSAYLGADAAQTMSGLFHSGWDNHGHFTTFSNTYEQGSTLWTTVDGSEAWNQWYPALHTTVWALAQYAVGAGELTRIELLQPFVVWNSLSFALAVAMLAYVAADIARRWSGKNIAGVAAASGFGVFALLGSMSNLYQAGFTNFTLALAVVLLASYLSTRSWRCARTVGWYAIPLAAVVTVGLWTPLALGLVPAGIVVALALWRHAHVPAIVWVIAAGAAGIYVAFSQSNAILGASETDVSGFTEIVGGIDTGMAGFNISLAIAAPFLALAIAIMVQRSARGPIGIGIAAPSVLTGVVAIIFMLGTDATGTSRLVSYYLLKSLDGAYVLTAPLIAAALAVGFITVLAPLSRLTQILSTAVVGILAVTAFGYVGSLPVSLNPGFELAQGVANANERADSIQNRLTGEAIVNAARAAEPNAEYTTLLWDGAGTLPNLWVASLTHVLSRQDQQFYLNLPEFPYDEKTAQYVEFQVTTNPNLSVNVLWFRDVSGQLLAPLPATSERIITTQVPMRSSELCQECSL